MKFTFQESLDRIEASAYVAAFFRPGFADIPPFFLDDVLRTDGRARKQSGRSVGLGEARDEVQVARDLKVPLAVLHGGEEQLVNGRYLRVGRDADPVARRGADDSPTLATRRNGRRRRPSMRSSKRSSRRRPRTGPPPGSWAAHFAIGAYLPAVHWLMS